MTTFTILRCLGLFFILSSLFSFSSGYAETELDVGYIPIMPMSQLFVMEGEGWTEEAGLTLNKKRFSSGPAIVQALASGELDVIYFGIGPAMVAKANGIDIRVVASNVMEQIAFIARGDLSKYMEGVDPKEAILKFTSDMGRKPKIASLPKGSVPDTVFRHWLIKVVGLTENDVDIVGMGASLVQQALLAGSIDGASILEPIVTIVQNRDSSVKVITFGGEMLQNQPGAIVAVRSEVLKESPEAIEKLIELHDRATAMIIAEPNRAAKHVHAAIGRGLIPVAMVEKAIKSPYSKFISDPHLIVDATKAMHDFQSEIGTLSKPVPLDTLFDTSYYDKAAGGQ